ncbi:MAG: hypothetical protein EPN89_17290, partial [Methylovulum sp.]
MNEMLTGKRTRGTAFCPVLWKITLFVQDPNMRINCCFPLRFNGLRPRIPTAKWRLPCALVLAALSLQVPAFALDVQVAGGSGGRVAIVPGDTDCALDCRIQVPPYSLLSLFALPDQDYRFQGWNGEIG